MRPVSAAIDAQLAQETGAAFRLLMQITPGMNGGGVTTKIATQDLLVGASTYAGELLTLSAIEARANRATDVRVKVVDTPELRAACQLAADVRIYLYKPGEPEPSGTTDQIFRGDIDDLQRNQGVIEFDVVSRLAQQTRVIGRALSLDDYPGADPSAVGITRNVLIGNLVDVECLPVDVGSVTPLVRDINDSQTTGIELSDATGFPASGTVQIGTEQITHTEINNSVLGGTVTRGANSTTAAQHTAGDQVIEDQAEFVYEIADHEIRTVDNVKVDGTRVAAAAASTLDGGIDAVTTSIALVDASAYPSKGSVQIDNEWIHYASISSNTLTGCTRGVNGTVAATHSSGASAPGYGYQVAIAASGVATLTFTGFPPGLVSGTLTIIDTTDVNDTIDVNDAITVGDNISNTTTASRGDTQNTTSSLPRTTTKSNNGNTTTTFNFPNPSTGGIIDQQLSFTWQVNWTTQLQQSGDKMYIDCRRGGGSWVRVWDYEVSGTTLFLSDTTTQAFLTGDSNSVDFRLTVSTINLSTLTMRMVALSRTVNTTATVSKSGGAFRGGAATKTGAATKIGTVTGSLANDVVGDRITVDVHGFADDGSGTYTGTPGALIERPDHVARFLLDRYGNAEPEELAPGDFEAFDGETLRFDLNSPTRLIDLLRSIAVQCRAIIDYSSGRWYMTKRPASVEFIDIGDGFDFDTAKPVRAEDGASSVSVDSGQLRNVVNYHSWRAGQRADRTWEFAGAKSDALSIANFGQREDSISLPYLGTEEQADAALAWLQSRSADPSLKLVTFVASMFGYRAEIGDVARIVSERVPVEVLGEINAVSMTLQGRAAGMVAITIGEAPSFATYNFADPFTDVDPATTAIFPHQPTGAYVGERHISAARVYRIGSATTRFRGTVITPDATGTVIASGGAGALWNHALADVNHVTLVYPRTLQGYVGDVSVNHGVNNDTIYCTGSSSVTLDLVAFRTSNPAVVAQAIGVPVGGGSEHKFVGYGLPRYMALAQVAQASATGGYVGELYAEENLGDMIIKATGGTSHNVNTIVLDLAA